ncbi:MAG TPA: aminopeptidase [Gemmatimonadetes bacterium]|nr:aminopeptidase [Gemmatimonadota bacterium]
MTRVSIPFPYSNQITPAPPNTWGLKLLPLAACLLLSVIACGGNDAPGLEDAHWTRAQRLESLLTTLAADSMEGRRTGTAGAHRAAEFLAAELERYGIEPAGDNGTYVQTVPMARITEETASGPRERFTLEIDYESWEALPAESIITTESNIIGIIRGSDPELANQAIVLGAHYDHLGIGSPILDSEDVPDSIYNGADDNGSGTAAVLEIARELIQGRTPLRTIVFLLSTGEEFGLLGTRYYIANPVIPLHQTVADLQIEMIGRVDDAAGGFGKAWLTGYERTTLGDQLAASKSHIVPDPRPDEDFFFRSDNVAFAVLGIPAHTMSSFGLHPDYHQPSDELDLIDFEHMSAVVDAAVELVRILADGPITDWKEGGREGLQNYW